MVIVFRFLRGFLGKCPSILTGGVDDAIVAWEIIICIVHNWFLRRPSSKFVMTLVVVLTQGIPFLNFSRSETEERLIYRDFSVTLCF